MRTRNVATAAVVIAGVLLTSRWTLARTTSPNTLPAAQDTTPLSAGLLRRVAEAADGFRDGRPAWFLVSQAEPYAVLGVYRDEKPRVAVPGARLVGPYVTPRDYDRAVIFVPRPHFPPTRYAMDSLWRLPARPWKVEDVDSMVVTAYHHSGARWRVASPGVQVDALFFTLGAHDKFVFPYYARVAGLGAAKAMRDSLGAYIEMEPEPRGRP